MHARPHRRKIQLPLQSLRDLRFPYIFAPARPRLARWERKRPQGTGGTGGNGNWSETRFTLGIIFIALDVIPLDVSPGGPSDVIHVTHPQKSL